MKVYNLASCTKVSPWVGVTNVVGKRGSRKLILARRACLHAIWGLWALMCLHQVTTCVACMRELAMCTLSIGVQLLGTHPRGQAAVLQASGSLI